MAEGVRSTHRVPLERAIEADITCHTDPSYRALIFRGDLHPSSSRTFLTQATLVLCLDLSISAAIIASPSITLAGYLLSMNMNTWDKTAMRKRKTVVALLSRVNEYRHQAGEVNMPEAGDVTRGIGCGP